MARESPSCNQRREAMECLPARSCTVTPLGHKCVVMAPNQKSFSLLGKRRSALPRWLPWIQCASK
ncbi:uncharacterized protein SCHCODRAFT_02521262 [Schizophyllum commune H4-8]|uniref:uncharacterized protein n=1 Tax=Schizophyllum commune (strain H4-8 / FGSC 9210) TaxID=578458 RepID=UPI00215FDEC1|nr:uncharacterized protein SCHCODRAFT_02521262 [Schizophyllum commune H4-8]KAI5885156.1 hypothetical protein SCHCODRAFT_02521262 [Schizophyllum commune H4-8]